MLLKRLSLQVCGLGLFCWLLAVGESGIVKRFFYTATKIHPAPMARPLSRAYGIWNDSYSLSYCYV